MGPVMPGEWGPRAWGGRGGPAVLSRSMLFNRKDVRPCIGPMASTDRPVPDLAVVWEVYQVASVLVDKVAAHGSVLRVGTSQDRVGCVGGCVVAPPREPQQGRRKKALRRVPHPDVCVEGRKMQGIVFPFRRNDLGLGWFVAVQALRFDGR
eukprot:3562706-Pyramimonas_sp.AAC.1